MTTDERDARGSRTAGGMGRRALIGGLLMAGNMPDGRAAVSEHTPSPRLGMSPLFARGASIVDQQGSPVMLHGVGWFEGYGNPGWLAGLDQVNWQQTMRDMVRLGFNSVRMHTYQKGVLNVMSGGEGTWPMGHGLNKTLNADLVGLSYLQVVDKMLDFAATIGLRVLIDSHASDGSVPNNGGRWAVGSVSDADFLRQWQYLANRWKGKPALVGYDVINEPQKCSWGDGGADDVRKMYSDVGNAILAIDPRPLIVCEGPGLWSKSRRSNFAGTHSGVFSEADLSLAQKFPVTCTVPAGAPPETSKVCYSVHAYPVPWTLGADSGRDCIVRMEACWGYLVTKDIAPVWLTELGCAPQNREQIDYLDTLIPYMAGTSPGYSRKPCHSAWWCWIPFGFFGRQQIDDGTITGWHNPSLLPQTVKWHRELFACKAT